MARAALIEHRPWLLASLAAAVAYYVMRELPIPGVQLALLKGLGVALLAIYCWVRAPGSDGRLIAGVMAFGAIGDMAIEFSFIAGGGAFFVGHLIAVALYLRNRRPSPSPSQKVTGLALLVVTPLVSWFLSLDAGVTLYAAGLGAMAATAWISRFGRYRVGTGAVLFVLSDWLIFSRMGTFDLAPLPDLLIWPLYYFGQFLIATGVVQALRRHARG